MRYIIAGLMEPRTEYKIEIEDVTRRSDNYTGATKYTVSLFENGELAHRYLAFDILRAGELALQMEAFVKYLKEANHD